MSDLTKVWACASAGYVTCCVFAEFVNKRLRPVPSSRPIVSSRVAIRGVGDARGTS